MSIAAVEAFFLIKDGISNRSSSENDQKLIYVGKANSFEKNNIYPFLSHKFYLKRFEDGGFMALSVKCTHLGCIVNMNATTGGFNCPCHTSQFDAFGQVISAPATRPLDIFAIQIKDGELFVDTSICRRRSSFKESQLIYV